MRRDFSQAGIREIDRGGSRHPRNVIGVDADAAFATRRTVFVVSVPAKKLLQLITGAPVMFASEDDPHARSGQVCKYDLCNQPGVFSRPLSAQQSVDVDSGLIQSFLHALFTKKDRFERLRCPIPEEGEFSTVPAWAPLHVLGASFTLRETFDS